MTYSYSVSYDCSDKTQSTESTKAFVEFVTSEESEEILALAKIVRELSDNECDAVTSNFAI